MSSAANFETPLPDTFEPEVEHVERIAGSDEMERSLAEAQRQFDQTRRDPELRTYINTQQADWVARQQARYQKGLRQPVNPNAPIQSDRLWRYVSDYAHYANTHSDHEPTRADNMAQLFLSLPDVVFSVQNLPKLIRNYQSDRSQFNADVLWYTQERVADFKMLMRTVISQYEPDLKPARLKYELRNAYVATGAVKTQQERDDALALINGTVNNACAAIGLEKMLATDPRIQVDEADHEDYMNDVALWATIAMDGRPVSESKKLLRVGVDPRYSIGAVRGERKRAGLPADDDNVSVIRTKGDVVHATTHCMLKREDFTGEFEPIDWVVEQRGPEAAQKFIDSIVAANVEHYSVEK